MNLGDALDLIIQGLGGPYVAGPLVVPGIGTGAAYASGDAMGALFSLAVPKRGTIHAAFFLDRDNEKIAKELVLSPYEFAATADNGVFAPAAADLIYFLTVRISAGDFGSGYSANAIGQVSALGIPYLAPAGRLYCQVVTRGADNIAAGAQPLVALAII